MDRVSESNEAKSRKMGDNKKEAKISDVFEFEDGI